MISKLEKETDTRCFWGVGFSYGRDVIHVGLLDHCAHGVFDGAVLKLVIRVLLPDQLQVEIWPTHAWFEELQVPRMRHGFGGVVELVLEGNGKVFLVRVEVLDQRFRPLQPSVPGQMLEDWEWRGGCQNVGRTGVDNGADELRHRRQRGPDLVPRVCIVR